MTEVKAMRMMAVERIRKMIRTIKKTENSYQDIQCQQHGHKTTWKRFATRSQLQAINKLAFGVHEPAQINPKRLKIENKDRR